MVRFCMPLIGALALAAGGCAPDPTTVAVPGATLAPIRMATCPGRVAAAAAATHCPEEPR
jgi:hypothetical protein